AAPESAEPAKPDSSASAPGAPVHASADRDSRRCSAACLCSVAFVLADALFLRRQSITELAAARGVSGPSPPALWTPTPVGSLPPGAASLSEVMVLSFEGGGGVTASGRARPELVGEVGELALCDLAVVGELEQVPAHVAQDLHRAPKILARLGLRRLGSRPRLDVIGLQHLERLRQ